MATWHWRAQCRTALEAILGLSTTTSSGGPLPCLPNYTAAGHALAFSEAPRGLAKPTEEVGDFQVGEVLRDLPHDAELMGAASFAGEDPGRALRAELLGAQTGGGVRADHRSNLRLGADEHPGYPRALLSCHSHS